MARQRVHNRRAGRGSAGGGASWISYSDMMAALLLVFVLILCVSKLLGVIDVFIQDHFTWELLLKTSKFIAKILITPITMTLNFFVMRGVVETL